MRVNLTNPKINLRPDSILPFKIITKTKKIIKKYSTIQFENKRIESYT